MKTKNSECSTQLKTIFQSEYVHTNDANRFQENYSRHRKGQEHIKLNINDKERKGKYLK